MTMPGKQDIIRRFIDEGLAKQRAGDFGGALTLYNKVLNIAPDSEELRFLVAECLLRLECNGLAVNVLQNLVRDNPDNSRAWCNLGVAYGKEGFVDDAESAWLRAIELDGDSEQVCGNLAGLFADSGHPEKAVAWGNRALDCNPDSIQARWHRGLARLAMHEFAAGWDDYEIRKEMPSWNPRRRIEAAEWAGEALSPESRLYLHGEQGLGDEILFLALIPRVIERVGEARITVEVGRKLAGLVEHTWPDVEVLADEGAATGRYTHKAALGSLPRLFWRDRGDIGGEPYLVPDPERQASYTRQLEALGPRPWVALAWFGGVKATNLLGRSVSLSVFGPLREACTCVSGQYEDVQPVGTVLSRKRREAGLPMLDIDSAGADAMAQAALFACCDAVVTVPQTALHVAGAVGARCYVLVPDAPDWRLGTGAADMPYYRSVRLVGKGADGSWESRLADIAAELSSGSRAAGP